MDFCRESGIKITKIKRTATISSTSIRSKVRNFWSSRAAKLDDCPAGVTTLGSFQGDQKEVEKESIREAELVIESVVDSTSKVLLDLGCGDGRLLEHLASKFISVKGVDFSSELVNLAKKRMAGNAENCSFAVADVTEYLDEDNYDVILLSGVISCLDDFQFDKLIPLVSNLAKNSANLIVRTSIGVNGRLNVVNQYSFELDDLYTAYYRTLDEIVEKFKTADWQIKESRELYQHRKETAVWWLVFERVK